MVVKLIHICEYCNNKISNKHFMKHKAEVHKDPKAIAILEELKDF